MTALPDMVKTILKVPNCMKQGIVSIGFPSQPNVTAKINLTFYQQFSSLRNLGKLQQQKEADLINTIF